MSSFLWFTVSEWVAIFSLSATLLGAYLIGNISPAILIGKMAGLDIRAKGSGNAGTTNVLRVLGKKAAVGTLLIDIGKGVVAVWLGRLVSGHFLSPDNGALFVMACGVLVFVGHIWPVIFGFRGGKGIATGFGAIVALSPPVGIGLAVIALSGIILSKRVSVGSILAAAAAPILGLIFARSYVIGLLMMGAIALYKHRGNIKRLLKGEEPKLSFKKQ